MKKCTFYRTVYKDRKIQAAQTEGFCETLTDKNGNEITLCFHKASDTDKASDAVWTVTEKSTGFGVCQGNNRMEALKEAKKYLDMIYEKIQQTQQIEKYKGIITKAYMEE